MHGDLGDPRGASPPDRASSGDAPPGSGPDGRPLPDEAPPGGAASAVAQAAADPDPRRLVDRLERRRVETAALLAVLPDLLLQIDVTGQITAVEGARGGTVARFFSVEPGRPLGEVFPADFAALVRRLSQRPAGGAEVVERSFESPQGELTVEARVVPFPRGAGVCILRDVSDRKRAERALVLAREEALAASRAKSDLLATMSHEIRTPMSGMLGMNGLLLETDLSAEQREYARAVGKSGEALLRVIDDILDFSKIEAGRLRIEPAPFALREAVEAVVELFGARARAKGTRLSLRFGAGVPSYAVGDVVRLRQVLSNLVGNAVKFTEEGRVEVRAEVAVERAEGPLLRVEVEDTGVGFQGDGARLFEPFTQADGDVGRRFGGTGLGLSISKRLVEAMGGGIGCRSARGRGSLFWFTVALGRRADPPIRRSAQAMPALHASKEQGIRVLVVDDNEVNRQIAVRILAKRGYVTDVASTGIEAVHAFEREHQQIILMDCQMPDMDGYEATSVIRAIAGDSPPFIVAMTASAMPGDREHCLAAGMDAYLAKPFRIGDLEALLARAASTMPPPPSGTPGDFDPESFFRLTGTDGSSAREFIEIFLSSTPRLLTSLHEAVAQRDAPRLRETAHALKGSLSYLSQGAALRAARRLEQAGRSGKLEGTEAMEKALVTVVRNLVRDLHAFLDRSAPRPGVDDAALGSPASAAPALH